MDQVSISYNCTLWALGFIQKLYKNYTIFQYSGMSANLSYNISMSIFFFNGISN